MNSNIQDLITVDGVTLPCPSTYEWGLMDISKAESGRNDKGTMIKGRVCQKRKITLAWITKNPSDTSKILKAVNPEYITVDYFDAMENKKQQRKFYVSDRTAPVKIWFEDGRRYFEKVSFEIIEV